METNGILMKNGRNATIAPHTPQEYSAVAHTAYRMLEDGCGRKDILGYTGIPDAHVRTMMTTEWGKAHVECLLEKMGKPVDREKISGIKTGSMGPKEFAEYLRTRRVRLGVTQAKLRKIVEEDEQERLQNRK